ncbi:MAG: hypothetical protein EXX96DRAFT_551430 [Benjaminiella poitrasii]|nr:MAG: hypothetical protein EXX96DRAFT_551430 [Benjaminiella poitrasii]
MTDCDSKNDINNRELQFDKGVMKLSAYDPLSNQYETRILSLPELPLLESLEHLFSNNDVPTTKMLRMSKSCSNSKKSASTRYIRSNNSITNESNSFYTAKAPRRRCKSSPGTSSPNILKEQPGKNITKEKVIAYIILKYSIVVSGGPMRSTKRTLLTAFNSAITGLIQKTTMIDKKAHYQTDCWKAETWFIELRLSTEAMVPSSIPSQQTISTCENWWMLSPSIQSF